MRNRFHSICPYYSMFPETFVEEWVQRLTEPGDVVLDPFCGRGTTPFQSLLMNRQAIGVDVNPVAYVLSGAKTNPPSVASVRRRLTLLERKLSEAAPDSTPSELPEFFHVAYERRTLSELVFMRRELKWQSSDVDRMIAALILGSLHGDRGPSYLSNRMPRTISTKPDYSVRFWQERGLQPARRPLFPLVRDRLAYRYESPTPALRGMIVHGDMRDIPYVTGLPTPVDAVITSPPYLDVTRAEEDQWLRIWFLGGHPRPAFGSVSRDDRYRGKNAYWRMIADFWRSVGSVLGSKAHVVIRIGGRQEPPASVVEHLEGSSAVSGRKVVLSEWSAGEIANRRSQSFQSAAAGCRYEVDVHFLVS